MRKLDGQIEEVNRWIDGANKKMDELDDRGPNDASIKVGYISVRYLSAIIKILDG